MARSRLAAGRGAFLPGQRAPRSRSRRGVSRADTGPRSRFSVELWAEEALNNLGTYYILKNDDAQAAQAFTELYEKFPGGQRAERAAWKSGWWAYKNAEYGETVRVFEKAAASFPRSDYRPLFLSWSARSHAKLGAGGDAQSRLRLIVADYGNSSSGRLAGRHLSRSAQTTLVADAVPAARQSPPRPADPANAGVIRLLLASELSTTR